MANTTIDLKNSKIPKQILKIALGAFLGIYIITNSFVYINPGHAGIFINRLNGEVDKESLGPGFKFKLVGIQDIVEYPTFMQTLVLTKSPNEGSPNNEEINVNSVEGQPISCDVSLSFEIDPSKVPSLYIMFRRDIREITEGYVKQSIRQVMQQVVGTYEVADFLGKEKSNIVNKVQQLLQQKLGDYGFIVKQFTINEIRPPETVLKAIESKNIMAQEALRSRNQLKKVEFEAQQQVAEAKGHAQAILTEAQAQAEANKILTKSLTPTLVKYKSIEKWSGKLPDIGSTKMPFTE